MKIALLSTGIWPISIGGLQKHTYYLCKFLAQRGVKIHLFHTSSSPEPPSMTDIFSEQELSNIETHYIPFPPYDRYPGHYLRASYNYSDLIRKKVEDLEAVDIIYAKGLTAWSLLKHRNGANHPPICINVHGYEYFQKAPDLKSRLQQLMLRPAFSYVNEKADYIYSYGEPISKIIRERIKGAASKIIEIPSGVDDSMLGEYPTVVNSVRELVFIGRFERRKGVHELNKAIRDLQGKFDFTFHFIGSIPDNMKLTFPNCIYHGTISDSNHIRQIVQKADILVCPSYAEGMPNSIFEGMSCGCAIIASNVGAIPLQVRPENGWLIPPGSVSHLSAAIVSALTMSADELLSRKQASYVIIKKEFMWEKITDLTFASFENIIRGSHRD